MRKLTSKEIDLLMQQGCTAESWDLISVDESFSPKRIRNCQFSGTIELGRFDNTIELKGGIKRPCGISNAMLHNVSVGNNCLIENINNYIANYTIEEQVVIRNANHIYCSGESSFGSGVPVSVLNEMGGREVLLCDALSSQLAYLMAFYRHNEELIKTIKALIDKEVYKKKSSIGTIKRESVLINIGTIKNVIVGEKCEIDGATKLSNGTINSNRHDPIFVGNGVMAEDFIFSSGSHIANGAVIVRCFIGQACHIGHLFSAHDSLFFSNCQGENGEACAVFAGPYTVSMHKSSLLIAGLFSFLNAGSGSNQSNHMYKLGPIHQGVVERGSKTTSDSYILWPAKIGAFSLVMGRHVRHADTSEMPFSYLIEKNDETWLVPGVNLKSVGTIRDAQKWPKRDNRKDPNKLDCINFNLLSPYTIQKMVRANEILKMLEETSGETSEVYSYQSAKIKNSSLRNGIKLYNKAIVKFLGNSIISRLKNVESGSNEELRQALRISTQTGAGQWVDICGMFAPQSVIDKLITYIIQGKLSSIAHIQEAFKTIHSKYYEYEWTWAAKVIENWYGKPLAEYTSKDVVRIVEDWKNAVISLDEMLYEDAKKEFSKTMQIGFGLDAHSCDEKKNDFIAVRGDFENNPFVLAVKQHIIDKSTLGEELISRITETIIPEKEPELAAADTSFSIELAFDEMLTEEPPVAEEPQLPENVVEEPLTYLSERIQELNDQLTEEDADDSSDFTNEEETYAMEEEESEEEEHEEESEFMDIREEIKEEIADEYEDYEQQEEKIEDRTPEQPVSSIYDMYLNKQLEGLTPEEEIHRSKLRSLLSDSVGVGDSTESIGGSVNRPATVADSIVKQGTSDISKAISLNDKYRFQRVLFDGNSQLMQSTFEMINNSSSFEEAMEFLQENFNWPSDDEDAAYFYSILDKQFV